MLDVVELEAATRAIDTTALSGGRKPLTPMELRTVSGPDRGKIHRIPEGKHLVGRGLDCTIVLADPAVSRKHFQIERSGDDAVLSDLGGANGTSINGVKMPRHTLESGDRIEIGTSVLEFYVEGAAPVARNRQAMPERKASATPQVQEERDAARKRMLVRVAAIFGIIAVGGGLGAFAFFALKKEKKAPQPVVEAPVDDGEAEVAAAIVKAKALLGESPPEFSSALDVLKAAKKKAPENKELRALIASTRREVDAEDTFEEAKAALKVGDFQGAITKFGEIDKDTAKYADAQDELTAAKESLFSQRMNEAKKANENGDTAAAIKALDAILALDPNRAEAKAMRTQLVGDAEPETAKKDEKKPELKLADAKVAEAKPAGKAELKKDDLKKDDAKKEIPPQQVVKIADEKLPAKIDARKDDAKKDELKKGDTKKESAKKEAAKSEEPKKDDKKADAKAEKADAGSKADFSAGLTAYHNRQWTAAVQAFDLVANSGHSKDQKAKAAAYAAAVRQVETSLNEAAAAGSNAKKAIAAYRKAYDTDRRVDGAHGAFIAGKLADAHLGLAKAAMSGKKYADAFEEANEALNFQPEKTEATQIVEKCMAQAGSMLKDAKDLMDNKKYMAARDLARTVAHILPASDKRAQEAQEIAKKATEMSRQDAD